MNMIAAPHAAAPSFKEKKITCPYYAAPRPETQKQTSRERRRPSSNLTQKWRSKRRTSPELQRSWFFMLYETIRGEKTKPRPSSSQQPTQRYKSSTQRRRGKYLGILCLLHNNPERKTEPHPPLSQQQTQRYKSSTQRTVLFL